MKIFCYALQEVMTLLTAQYDEILDGNIYICKRSNGEKIELIDGEFI